MRKFLACSIVGVAVFGGALSACGGGGGGGGGSQQAFCDALKNDKKVFSDLSNQSDLTDTQSLQLTTKALDDLVSKAPAEIKSDMQAVDKAVKDSFALLGQLSDFTNQDKLSSLDKKFSDENKNIEQASANVEKFAKDKCGIDLTSDSSTSSSSRSSSSRSSSSSDQFSNLSDLSDFSDFSNLSDFSDSLNSAFSSLSSLFSS